MGGIEVAILDYLTGHHLVILSLAKDTFENELFQK
jgi:hypothetical protein